MSRGKGILRLCLFSGKPVFKKPQDFLRPHAAVRSCPRFFCAVPVCCAVLLWPSVPDRQTPQGADTAAAVQRPAETVLVVKEEPRGLFARLRRSLFGRRGK